jgi:hypothetical protein
MANERGTPVPGRQTLVDHERRSGVRRAVAPPPPETEPARPLSVTWTGSARGSAP